MGLLHHILNSRSQKNGDFFISLHQLLGFRPQKLAYYRCAFTHASTHKTDADGHSLNYERLEFLGDAVLSAVVAGYLFEALPHADEGQLTKMRSKLVSRGYLNQLGRDFELVSFMESPFHPDQFGENVYGNLFEALIGAIYRDQGYACCETFIHQKVIQAYVDLHQLKGKIISYKSHLIEWCQKEKIPFDFRSEDLQGNCPKQFEVKLKIAGQTLSGAKSTSKKKAEEKAAKKAYFILQQQMSVEQ